MKNILVQILVIFAAFNANVSFAQDAKVRLTPVKKISNLQVLTCVSSEMMWAKFSGEEPLFYLQLADGWNSILIEKMGKSEAESFTTKNLRKVAVPQLEDNKLLVKQHLDCFKLYTELP